MQERIKLFNELNSLLKKKGVTAPLDKALMCFTGKWELDIIALDESFGQKDSDYNSDKCTYKGEPCSMREYIEKVFGQRAYDIVKLLM